MQDNYIQYLFDVTKELNKFFEAQKNYIFCKKGCAKCCKNAVFPYTEVEFNLLIRGMMNLDKKLQPQIMDKVEEIIQAKKFTTEKPFVYDCPFLINDVCSVYNYRGLICRAFGLMSFKKGSNEKTKVPFCAFEGLNYSNVVDVDTQIVSGEKVKATGFETEPLAYNISYSTLTDESKAKSYGFTFGESKPLIDWFENV